MKRSMIVISVVLVLGGYLALSQQHKPQSFETANTTSTKHINVPKAPLLIDSVIKDSVSGQASAQARFATFQRSQPLLKLGRAAMGNKQYEQAQSLFLQAIKIYAEDPFSWLLLADAYERQGKYSKALEAYHTLVYSDGWGGSVGSDPTIHMRFVLALCRSNQYPEAAAVFNETMDDSARGSIPDEVMVNAKQIGGDAALAPYIEKYSLLPMRFDANDPDKRLLQAAAHYVLGTKQPSFASPGAGEQMRHLQAAIRLAPKWGQAHSALCRRVATAGTNSGGKSGAETRPRARRS